MIHQAVASLRSFGYDLEPLQTLVQAEMPAGYRGMSLLMVRRLEKRLFLLRPC
jgi:hypothetical protein